MNEVIQQLIDRKSVRAFTDQGYGENFGVNIDITNHL